MNRKPNSEIRLCQVGLGAWGKNLLRNFDMTPGVTLVAACDENPEAVSRFSKQYSDTSFVTDLDRLLGAFDFDALVVATPPDSHYRIARQALLSGRDVFVEKPMALKVEHGRELVDIARAEGRILMVGHIMEYHPGVLKLKSLIEEGELGSVYYLYGSRVNLGIVRTNENSLWSFAPHDISMIAFLLEQTPVRVSSSGASYLQKGIEDVVFTSLFFADGKVAHMHVSWLDPHKIRKLTVVGSRKMAVFDDTSTEKIRIYDKGVDQKLDYETYGEYLTLRAGDIVIPKIPNVEPLSVECRHFVECVADRKAPRSDGEDGLRVLKVLDAAQKSLKRNGAPVDIED